MRILFPLLLISTAACTPTARDLDRQAATEAGDRAAIDKEVAGLVPGKPQTCVQQFLLRDQRAYGDTIVYRTSGNEKYVNRTSGGCGRIGDDAYLVTRTPTSQLCRGDIAQAVNRTSQFPTGSCTYGDFVRYTKP